MKEKTGTMKQDDSDQSIHTTDAYINLSGMGLRHKDNSNNNRKL